VKSSMSRPAACIASKKAFLYRLSIERIYLSSYFLSRVSTTTSAQGAKHLHPRESMRPQTNPTRRATDRDRGRTQSPPRPKAGRRTGARGAVALITGPAICGDRQLTTYHRGNDTRSIASGIRHAFSVTHVGERVIACAYSHITVHSNMLLAERNPGIRALFGVLVVFSNRSRTCANRLR
jgi:hypothetical protein